MWKRWWPEWLCLALYMSLIAAAIPFHEPWADEAQAWQLARSLTPWQLLHGHLGYEGTPVLWYLLLWILIHLGVGYTGMHWVCGGIAALGVALLIFQAPLPRYLKLLLPFTYFLAFQYAIVARGYVLIPVLMFSAAALWRRGPLAIAFLLGLLANVAGHALAMAAGLALIYGVEQWKQRSYPVKSYAVAAIVALICFGLAIFTAWPPNDLYLASYRAGAMQLHKPSALTFAARFVLALSWGMLEPVILAAPFWCVLIWYLWRNGLSRYLLPVASFAVFSGAVYLTFWHAGLIIPLLIFVLWRTWPQVPAGRSKPAMTAVLLCVIGVQIGWTVHAVAYDHSHDYSPDLAAARFLGPYIESGDTVAVTYLRRTGVQAFPAVGILPYFSSRIYINQALPYWWWSTRDSTEANFLKVLPAHPQIVVAEYFGPEKFQPQRDLSGEKLSLLTRNGYTLRRVFCATKPERFGYRENICHLIFMR